MGDLIRPRKLSTNSRLRSIDHQVRNVAQPIKDVADLAIGWREEIAALGAKVETNRAEFSSERRAYIADHERALAETRANGTAIATTQAQVSVLSTRFETHATATDQKLEKMNGSINRGIGAVAAIGIIVELLKYLAEHK